MNGGEERALVYPARGGHLIELWKKGMKKIRKSAIQQMINKAIHNFEKIQTI